MSESVELNKKLTDTHIPTSIQLSQCPCLCCSCVDGQTIWNHTLSQKHIKVWELLLYRITCQVHRMCLQSPRNRRVSIAVGESRLLDFIGMRAVLEGFPSWAQSGGGSSRQTVNLQAAQWPAFKFSPRSPVTPLGHTLSKLKHTAHTKSIWTVMRTHTENRWVPGPSSYAAQPRWRQQRMRSVYRSEWTSHVSMVHVIAIFVTEAYYI